MDRAAAYYRLLSSVRDDVVLYHSRFTEPHKAEKEEQVRAMLGEEGRGGVAVLTQIGEMSLNISAPVMVSELCPIDRLAQRTGRMNRFSDRDGTLHLLRALRDGVLYPAPYGSLVRGEGWIPSDTLLDTDEELQEGQRLTKIDFRECTNAVCDEALTLSDRARHNRDALDEEFRHHWLIGPETTRAEDETDTDRWQSRIIGPQVDVFVSTDRVQESYDDYWSYERATSRHTVSVPTYRLDQYPDRFASWEVAVGVDNDEQVSALTEPSPYDEETGLVFR